MRRYLCRWLALVLFGAAVVYYLLWLTYRFALGVVG